MLLEAINCPEGMLIDGVVYPDWSQHPMGESSYHLDAIRRLLDLVESIDLGRPDVFISGDTPWFYERGNPAATRCPDVFVVKGVAVGANVRNFASFQWGVVPCFVAEILSVSTWRTDLSDKVPLSLRLGVREVFLFDPEAEFLPQPLVGYRRNDAGEGVPIEAGEFGLWSEELGHWVFAEGRFARLCDRDGVLVPTPDERADAAEERTRAATDRLAAAEAELARLRALLGPQQSPPPAGE